MKGMELKMKVLYRNFTLLRFVTFSLGCLLIINQAYAQTVGNTTPTKYIITVGNIKLHHSGVGKGKYVDYAPGFQSFDIAEVNPTTPVGYLIPSGSVVPAVYDKIQFEVSKMITIQGSLETSPGKICRTITNGAIVYDPLENGGISQVSLGTFTAGSPEPQVVTVPSGWLVTLPASVKDNGSTFLITQDIKLAAGSTVPTITISFNVTNAMTVAPEVTGTFCYVYPNPPSYTVTIS